jgi:hypothetical protein
MTRASIALLCLLAAVSAGCGDDSPTAPTPETPVVVTELFSGTLSAGGNGFYSFSVPTTSSVGITLVSLTPSASGPALTTPMTIGLGQPEGTGCKLTTSLTVTPGLAPQISRPLDPNIYCASIADAGGLSATTNFVVRIMKVPSGFSFPTGSPKTEKFETNLPVGGAVTRTFTATQAGNVTFTLQNTTPGGAAVGLGIGFWRGDGVTCSLTRSLTVTPGSSPQISIDVDPGTYCAKLFDVATLTEPVFFTLEIVFP